MPCLGRWDDDWTEQLTPDFCVPQKIGDCWNMCPVDCTGWKFCPGGTDAAGCKKPDTCEPNWSECED